MINPEECIDCGACVDPCPVEAIHHEDELPDKWNSFIDKAKSTDFDSLSPAERNG
jgi:ferredoxin